jgi:hypothetical protein
MIRNPPANAERAEREEKGEIEELHSISINCTETDGLYMSPEGTIECILRCNQWPLPMSIYPERFRAAVHPVEESRGF